MILSDRDIKRYIKTGKIVISPEPKIEGSSVDLRLANKFKKVLPNDEIEVINFQTKAVRHESVIDPKKKQETEEEIVGKVAGDYYLIFPGEMILASTIERVKIDDSVSAFVQGRSSYARIGLAIEIAGFADAGFEGTITLEMVNTSRYPIKLYPGERICQIIFMPMSSKPEMPYNKKPSAKYMGQTDPEASRISSELNE